MNSPEVEPGNTINCPLKIPTVGRCLPSLTLLAGLFLLPLLFQGIFAGLSSWQFHYTFYFHSSLLICAVIGSIVLYCQLAWSSRITIVPWLLAGTFFVAVVLTLTGLPITSRDALIHHMAVPRWWVDAGRIQSIPWHDWSFYPMLINLGFCGLLSNGLENLCALYHALYLLPLCGIVALLVLKRSQNADAACISFLITLSMPVCIRLASVPLVDLGLAVYVALAIFFAIQWSENEGRAFSIVAAGLSLGLALGCKYNGLLAALLLIPLLIVLGKQARLSDGRVLLGVTLCGMFAALTFSPWLIKNTLWTGNPIYPLYKSYLGNLDNLPKVEMPRSLPALQQRILLYQETPLDILLTPLRMIFFGEDDNPRQFDGVLTPVLLFALLPLIRVRREPWLVFTIWFTVLYFSFAIIMAAPRTRYLTPIFGSVLMLTGYGLSMALKALQGYRWYLMGAIMLMHLSHACIYALGQISSANALAYYRGELTREEYKARRIAEYPIIRYVNDELKKPGRIYLLFTGNRYYYYDKPVLSSGHYSDRMVRQLASSGEAKLMAQEFLNRDIRFILEDSDRRLKSFDENEPDITDRERSFRKLYREFNANHLKLRYQFGQFALWEIMASAPSEQSSHL